MHDFRFSLKESERGQHYRMFYVLWFGDVALSVQASTAHYCYPRLTLAPLKYNSWELALLRNGYLVDPRIDPVMRGAEKLIDKDHWERGPCPVGGHIPTKTVQAIIDHLEQKAKAQQLT